MEVRVQVPGFWKLLKRGGIYSRFPQTGAEIPRLAEHVEVLRKDRRIHSTLAVTAVREARRNACNPRSS
jgi:hypothetical protein